MGEVIRLMPKPRIFEVSRPTMQEMAFDCLPIQRLSNLVMRVSLLDLNKKELEIISDARKVSLNTDKRLVWAFALCLEIILDKRDGVIK